MINKPTFLLLAALLVVTNLWGQSLYCPPNIDFEMGNTSIWNYYTGTCCPLSATTSTAPLTSRHEVTSGTATDPFGGFPIVAPGGGSYSLKLGNSSVGAQSEKARYYVHIPATSSYYSLVYKYAVVFEEPGHPFPEQPRFEVHTYDSATLAPISCGSHTYVADSMLPGFNESLVRPDVLYKSWTTGVINLSGMAGTTVIVDFATSDCGYGGHFGYGYLDMSCGLFAISTAACDADTVRLEGPDGFHDYYWYDSVTMTFIDSGKIVAIPTPTIATTYAVVVVPDAGFGCSDTLYSTVSPSHLAITPMNDTLVCPSAGAVLKAIASDGVLPLTYSWTPTTGLSCATCDSITVNPDVVGEYIVEVTNPQGCKVYDTVNIMHTITVNKISDTLLCDTSNLQLTAVTTAVSPISYLWSPSTGLSCTTCYNPVMTSTLNSTYMLTVTDTSGCTLNDTVSIQRELLTAEKINDTLICNDETLFVHASVTSSFTQITYLWAPSVGLSCNTCASVTINPGNTTTYTLLASGPGGCSINDTFVITVDKLALTLGNDTIVCENSDLQLVATTDAPSVTYNWTPATGLNCATCASVIANTKYPEKYTVSITDTFGCKTSESIFVDRSTMQLFIANDTSLCEGLIMSLANIIHYEDFPVSFRWSPPEGLSCTDCGTPSVIAQGVTKTYVVTATDSLGCEYTDSVTINAEQCDIWFPNAFTPNGDGKNDFARAVGHLDDYRNFSFSIFNRYGQRVFFTDDIYKGWNGEFNGEKQDLGVYFYYAQFTLHDKRYMVKGDITLVR